MALLILLAAFACLKTTLLTMRIIRKTTVSMVLISVYGFTYLTVLVGSIIPRRRWKPTGRIMVTGTFFNPNWYLSHIAPLSRSGVKEVILVVDQPQLPLERVRFVCPPKWLSRLISRAGAKAIWMFFAGLRYRPDLYMGYYLAPGACSALVAGKLLGRPSCYQMTGGPIEIRDGMGTIESVRGPLERPGKLVKRMAIGIVRKFDLVVVRGNKAKGFLTAYDIKESVAIITGSVDSSWQPQQNNREIHLVFVGRLVPIKQIHQFISSVGAVKCKIPDVKAVIIGDGPLREELQTYSDELGLGDNIEFLGKVTDVESILTRSKIFVLTSKSEGLSIAMAEAMTVGVVPVVADVGELSDLVIDGVNGYLVKPNYIAGYSERIVSLLEDHPMWEQFSHRAIEKAKEHCDIEVVAEKWRQNLRDVVSRACDHRT